jgi:NhaC family Na+:H+ antiporter
LLVVFTVRKVPPFLAIQTASYLPFCFFNLLSPVLDVLYGFIGFKVRQVQPPVVTAAPEAVEAQSA